MKFLIPVVVLALLSAAAVAAQCRPGDEPGRVYKVIDQDVSSQVRGGPQAASEDAPSPKAVTLRSALFSFGNRRYSLLLRSPNSQVNLSDGQSVCLHVENGEAKIVTQQGLILPGVARIVPAITGTKKPGVSARPVPNK